MYPKTVPLICDFTLHCMQEENMFNKLNPLELECQGNKVRRYEIVEYCQSKVVIHALYWKNERLLEGITLLHFTEIVQGFLHNQLTREQSYTVFDTMLKRGIGIQMIFKEEPYLAIYALTSLDGINRQEIALLNKVECRILARLLNHYISGNAIFEGACNGSTECRYGTCLFTLQERYQ